MISARRVGRRTGRRRFLVVGCWVATCVAASTLTHGPALQAQSSRLPVISSQRHYTRGQYVVPLYQGWYRDTDGQIFVVFGYLNRNSEETLDIPVGPDNAVAPGPADQDQPTHFLPGHHDGVFVVALPKGSTTEVTWTLSIRGETITMPSNLGPLYQIDGLVALGGSFPGNTPPILKFAPDGASVQGPAGLTTTISAQAQKPVPLDVWVADDGLPPRPDRSKVIRSLQRSYRQGDASEESMTVSWSQYRGSGTVSFQSVTPVVEQGTASTSATFSEPGEYVLRALVSDGSGFDGCCWTNGYVKVNVRLADQP